MSRSSGRLSPQPVDTLVGLMITLNMAATFGIFAIWPNYSDAIADPLSIVAGGGIPDSPSMFEYPYIMLWAIPLAAVCGAYVFRSLQMARMARLFAVFPLVLAIACTSWLYFSYGYWNPHS